MTLTAPAPAAETPRSRRRAPRPVQRVRDSYRRYWYAYAMIAPVVIVLGVLVGYPLLRGFYLTLTDANSLNSARTIGVNTIDATYKFIGLDNYAEILWGPAAYDRFWSHFVWTIVWTVTCVVLHYAIGLGLAMLLNQRLRGRVAYRLLLILPWAVPTFVTVFASGLKSSVAHIIEENFAGGLVIENSDGFSPIFHHASSRCSRTTSTWRSRIPSVLSWKPSGWSSVCSGSSWSMELTWRSRTPGSATTVLRCRGNPSVRRISLGPIRR